MNKPVFTPEQEAAIVESIRLHKPYLLRIEEEVASTQHGSIELVIDVRSGSVDKITFISRKSWLRRAES